MPLHIPQLALASITLPEAFWSLFFAIAVAGVSAFLATWRSSAVYAEKFSNHKAILDQLAKDFESRSVVLQRQIDAIKSDCTAEHSKSRLTTLEVQMRSADQLGRDLLKYRETDVKELNRLISEIQQWMSRLETMVEFAINKDDKG